jgi:hypothetical protein
MFEIACGCGKTVRVSAAQAGSTVTCDCGQPVRVPALSRLRQAVERRTEPTSAIREHEAWWWGVGFLVGGAVAQLAGAAVFAGTYSELEGMFAFMAIVVGFVLDVVGILLVGMGKGFKLPLLLLLLFCAPKICVLLVLLLPGPRTGGRRKTRRRSQEELDFDDEPGGDPDD